MVENNKYPVIYRHRLVMIGSEWYADVEVQDIDPEFNRADLLPMLFVKHGWPHPHIVISDISGAPLSGVSFVPYEVGQKLRKLHLDGQRDPRLWRHDMNIIIPWTPSGLRADEPLVRDFS